MEKPIAKFRRWLRFPLLAASLLSSFLLGSMVGRTDDAYRILYAAPPGERFKAAARQLIGQEKHYGQFAQDLWVTHGVAPGKRDGFYLDVGSADGERLSNTKLLDEMGWKGICIDPFPRNMSHRTCKMIRQPAFNESGKKVQFRAAGDWGGIESDLNQHKKEAMQGQLVEFVTTTLDDVLAETHAPRYIAYMNLDVEGAEYDVLKGLSLDKYEFGSFTVEHNYETEKREAIHRLLAAKGYVRVRSWEVDDWYVNGKIAPQFPTFLSYCTAGPGCSYQ